MAQKSVATPAASLGKGTQVFNLISPMLRDDCNGLWFQSNTVEMLMAEHGLEWTIIDMPLDQYDEAASIKLNTRAGQPRVEEVISIYTNRMIAKTAFTMPVVHPHGKMFRSLDGLQRLTSAARAGRTHVRVYLLTKYDEDEATKFARIVNSRVNGAPPTYKQRLVNAIADVVDFNVDVEVAAKHHGFTKSTLEGHIDAGKVKDVLDRAGLLPKDTSGFITHLSKLSRYLNHIPVLKTAGRALFEENLTIEEVVSMIDAIDTETSEDTKIQAVRLWLDLRQKSKAPPKRKKADDGPSLPRSAQWFKKLNNGLIEFDDEYGAFKNLTSLGFEDIDSRKEMADMVRYNIRTLARFLPANDKFLEAMDDFLGPEEDE